LKKELFEIFRELLNDWEQSEIAGISEFDTSLKNDPYEKLEQRKQDYIKRFNNVLNDYYY
jgi:hypothetical protein